MKQIDRLLDIIAELRRRCPWTRELTHEKLTPYLLEEAAEAADAIDQGHVDTELKGELGDVLLQITLHAVIAQERGSFDFDAVAGAIADKLVRRYPTILGDEPDTLTTAEEIDRRWEEIKAEERKAKGLTEDSSILDDISRGLPALLRASKLKSRASREGWEWPDVSHLLDKISEEVGELQQELSAANADKERIADEFGDLLYMMVDFARWHGIDAEDALRRTNNRFERRFRHMERKLKAMGKTIRTATREERIALWNEAKAAEKAA